MNTKAQAIPFAAPVRDLRPKGFTVYEFDKEVVLHAREDAEAKANALAEAEKQKYRLVTRYSCGAFRSELADFRVKEDWTA